MSSLRSDYLGKLSVGTIFRFLHDETEFIVTDQTMSSTRTYYTDKQGNGSYGANTMTLVLIVKTAWEVAHS